jgi:hypothetical protein
MDALANRIARELKASNHCIVSKAELSRVWPISDKDREGKVKEFARRNGLQVVFYKEGLCAIFIRDVRSSMAEVSPKEKSELKHLREAATWLKKMEQRYAQRRKQVEARYRELLESTRKVSKRHKCA